MSSSRTTIQASFYFSFKFLPLGRQSYLRSVICGALTTSVSLIDLTIITVFCFKLLGCQLMVASATIVRVRAFQSSQ